MRMPGIAPECGSSTKRPSDLSPASEAARTMPFGDAEAHLARGEVGDHDRHAAFELLGLVGACNAGEDVAGAAFAQIEREAQKLRGAFDGLALDDLGDAQVDLREVVDRALGSDGFAAGQDGFGLGSLFGDEDVKLLFHVDALHQVLEGLDRARGGERHGDARPGERFDREEVLDAGGRGGQHGLEVEREQAEAFEGDRGDAVQFGPGLGVLGELPRLFLIDELVDLVGELHYEARGAGELADFEEALDFLGAAADGFKQRILHGGIVDAALELLEDEARGAAGDVDVLADQVGVDALGEVGLREVDVLDAGVHLGGKVVAEPFGVHAELEVLQRRDAGAAALGHLLAVDGHEAVGVDVIGHAEGLAGKVQHGGPEERVEVDDVLADEVDLLRLFVGEDAFEVEALLVAVVLERGEVADGGVKPDVEVLARSVGNGDAEVRFVAGDVPV